MQGKIAHFDQVDGKLQAGLLAVDVQHRQPRVATRRQQHKQQVGRPPRRARLEGLPQPQRYCRSNARLSGPHAVHCSGRD